MMKTFEMDGKAYNCTVASSDIASCSTQHGFIRTMERADRSSEQTLRMIQNAWERGRTIDHAKMIWQRKYLERRNSLLIDGYTELRAYCGYLFIFSSDGQLITMYALPDNWEKKSLYSQGKSRVRNIRKYNRTHDCREERDYDPNDSIA